MIPIRDFNPSRSFPYVTVAIIVVNFVVFLFVEPSVNSDSANQQAFFYCNAEIPYEITHHTNLADGGAGAAQAIARDYSVTPADGAALQQDLASRCPHKFWLWSIVEAMFLHAGWLHILGNMLYLWIFGDNVEDRLGRVGYLVFYLLGGFAATGLQLAVQPNSTVPNLGASGAIAAVLGAYLLFYPNARVLVIGFPFFIFPLRAVWVLGFWFLIQLVYGAGSLGTQVNGGVAYWAHVGGFAFGLAVAWVLLRRTPRQRPMAYS